MLPPTQVMEHFVDFMSPPLREGQTLQQNGIEVDWLSQTAWSSPTDTVHLSGFNPSTNSSVWEVSPSPNKEWVHSTRRNMARFRTLYRIFRYLDESTRALKAM